MHPRVVAEYTLRSARIDRPYCAIIAADLHNRPFEDILVACAHADLLLLPGDLIHRYPRKAENGVAFLQAAAKRLPTYYTFGNHEDLCDEAFEARVRSSGAILLNNAYCRHDGLVIGGMRLYDKPRLLHRHDRRNIGDGLAGAAERMLEELEREQGFRLLLSHKPEHFPRWVGAREIDLTISGHAHGGQIRLLGRGLYAPNQGVLPRYTHGLYFDGRLLVSSGAANTGHGIPRIGNPCEIVRLRLVPQ